MRSPGGCAVRARHYSPVAALVVAAALVAWGAKPSHTGSPVETVAVQSRPIGQFKIGSAERRFGRLEFQGGLELWSGDPRFGSMSSFRFFEPGKKFIGVEDTGYLYSGSLEHAADGSPSGVSQYRYRSIAEFEQHGEDDKWETDAEGTAIDGNRLLISFERDHRITQYRTDPQTLQTSVVGNIAFLVPRNELRRNRSFETIAIAPKTNPRAGMMVTVTEKSLDRDGNIFAAVLNGPEKGVFKVLRRDNFDPTDGAFLPNGDFLLLERSFSIADGIGMRLRRIPGDRLKKGALADGEILLSADMGYQIDNMEGLDVWKRADGATMVSMVSDDNQSLLQRSIYLEFRLLDASE